MKNLTDTDIVDLRMSVHNGSSFYKAFGKIIIIYFRIKDDIIDFELQTLDTHKYEKNLVQDQKENLRNMVGNQAYFSIFCVFITYISI